MPGIKVGDNGVALELQVLENGSKVSIAKATISVVIKIGDRRFTKQAQVKDVLNGLCEVILTKDDINIEGWYHVQGIVRYENGNEFTGDVETFLVSNRL